MQPHLLTILAGAILGAVAQDASAPTSSPGVSCVIQCSTQALPSGPCGAITDFQCICTSAAYQQAVRDCLSANCTPEDMTTAMSLQQQNCGSLSASGSGTPSATGTAPPSSAPATAPSSVPPTSGSSTTTPRPTTVPPSGSGSSRPASSGTSSSRPAASSTTTRNAAEGQHATLFSPQVVIALGMVWAGVFLGVLVA
ncbi:hypothetical protein VNI00_008163 [Paramarasmius palmivorus]|uniref:CFEM domain-containing protein n=1 Tax=Paramarasmius palmivorus TaxID=297713 RepID=A0AAW0CV94_9AGAR